MTSYLYTTGPGVMARDNGQRGVLAPSTVGWSNAGNGLVANQAYGSRFIAGRTFTTTVIAFAVSTAASVDDSVDVGIYDGALNRLASSGATAGRLNGTGAKTVPLSFTVQAGAVYYAVMACGPVGGTAATVRGANFGDTFTPVLFGLVAPALESWFKTASYPLPATITSPSAAQLTSILAVREA